MIIPGIPFVQGKNNYTDSDGIKYGIAVHNTSNDASDAGEASYGTWRPDGTSAHLYADADSVTQSLDTDAKAGHAGSAPGNENAVAVEITGTNDKSRDWWLANVAWDKLGAVLATVIRHHWPDGTFQVRRATVAEMKANPKVKALYSHNDMRLAWGGTTHDDPGPNFPWDRLFTAINAALGSNEGDDLLSDADINKIVSQVVNALINESTNAGYVAGAPNDPLNKAIAISMNRTVGDLHTKVDQLLNRPEPAIDAAALAAELSTLGASGLTVSQVEAAVSRVFADTRFTPTPK